jgi:hypothetical protein
VRSIWPACICRNHSSARTFTLSTGRALANIVMSVVMSVPLCSSFVLNAYIVFDENGKITGITFTSIDHE